MTECMKASKSENISKLERQTCNRLTDSYIDWVCSTFEYIAVPPTDTNA